MCMGKTHSMRFWRIFSEDNPHVHGEDVGSVYGSDGVDRIIPMCMGKTAQK